MDKAEHYKRRFLEAIKGNERLIHELAVLTEKYIEAYTIPLRPIYGDNPEMDEETGYLLPDRIESAGTEQEKMHDDILRNFRGHMVILDAIANDGADFDEVFDVWGTIPHGTSRLEILTVYDPMPTMNQICLACVRLADSPHDCGDIIAMPDAIRAMKGAKPLIEKLHGIGRERGTADLY